MQLNQEKARTKATFTRERNLPLALSNKEIPSRRKL